MMNLMLALLLLPLAAAAALPATDAPHPARTTVVLASDGTGDFGPQTPGTKTAGWQEALDHCVKAHRDLSVKGGYGGLDAIYHVRDTIRFPPAQDFRVDGGIYVVNWTGPADRDLMVIDSSMNCEYHLGILVYGGERAALRVRPERPVPIDNFPICVETRIETQGMADPHPFARGERKAGVGVVFDGTRAPIIHSDFRFESVLNFRTCIEVGAGVTHNRLLCPHLHTNADRGTLMTVHPGAAANTVACTMGVDQGAEGVTGIVLCGRRNVLEIGRRGSDRPFPPGRSLIFERAAEGNQVNLVDAALDDPAGILTDLADTPTNQVTWAGPPAPIRTVAATPGVFAYTQRLFPATVRVEGGRAVRAALERGGRRAAVDGAAGIAMSVGDRLVVRSARPPRLVVIPLKVR